MRGRDQGLDRFILSVLLHILPEDGLGGVEVAARRSALAAPDVVTVAALGGAAPPARERIVRFGERSPLSPVAAWRAGGAARGFPVAAFSLWKSILAMLACAIRSPGTRRVLFLHSDRRVHLADSLATALAVPLSHEIWADSRTSIEGLPAARRRKTVVISFLTRRFAGLRRTSPRPRFIFWGRLTPLKRIDRAIDLFARIAEARPDASLLLIGPDDGCEVALKAQVAALGLEDKVTFAGPMDHDAIAAVAPEHDFFIQLSKQEGAAMSLIEAMQLGLAPVVTPVGEMPRYVSHMERGVIYETEAQAAADVLRLLEEPELFARISGEAIDHWAGRRLYEEDVVAAARDLARREV